MCVIWWRVCFIGILLTEQFSHISGDENNVFLYNHAKNCKGTEYFDVNFFQCRLCDAQLNLVPTQNGLDCTCRSNAFTEVEYDSNLRHPICVPNYCATNSTLSNCTAIATLSSLKCNLFYLREIFSSIQSTKSVQITRFPDPHNIAFNTSHNGTCDDTPLLCADPRNHIHFNDYCIPNVLLKDYQSYKQFKSSTTNVVDVFADLEVLIFFCHALKMHTYCERVANLCVLTMYSLEKYSPCNIFFAAQTTLIGNGIDGFQSKIVPFLFYVKGKGTVDDLNKVIEQRYMYRRHHSEYELFEQFPKTNIISLIVVGHNLDGELQTIRPLQLTDFNLCVENSPTKRSVRFGESIVNTCRLDLKTFIEVGEERPWFFNLYLNYTENNLNLVKPVPVLIRNAFSHNTNPFEREKWQFVKRFFFVDVFSARNRTYRPALFDQENYAEKYTSIRYIQSMELLFELHENHFYYGNKISVPLLIVEYGDYDMRSYRAGNNIEVEFEFKVTFVKNFSLSIFFHILLTIGLAAGVGMAIFQTISFKTRKQQIDYDSAVFIQFGVNLCSTMANVLFALAFILTLYIYYVYKTQLIVRVLPPFDELRTIKFFIISAFMLKCVKFYYQLNQNLNCDIFFIDWERPRVFEHQITLKPTNNLDTPSICSSARQYQQNDGLSAWRTYFVANEWIRLSTKRKSSLSIQILGVLLMIIIFNFNWHQMFAFHSIFHWPWTSNADKAIQNGQSLEMLAIGLIIYTLCYCIQRLFHFLIYERFVNNAIQQFVDICSMSNISVFIFSLDAYGYYVHGRSPHGFADTDMCSMLQQLRREGDNMCGHRGLLPNSEHQTFCFLAPMNLRSLYNKLKTNLQSSIVDSNGLQSHQQNGIEVVSGKWNENHLKQIAHANTTINRFLSAFIDHGLKDLDYTIQEKTILECIFDFEFDTNVNENRGTFYLDNGHSFDNVLFYGNEQLLFGMELMLFCSLMVICGNFLFSLLLVGIVQEVLRHAVRLLVKKNLSKQTLIDERFLI